MPHSHSSRTETTSMLGAADCTLVAKWCCGLHGLCGQRLQGCQNAPSPSRPRSRLGDSCGPWESSSPASIEEPYLDLPWPCRVHLSDSLCPEHSRLNREASSIPSEKQLWLLGIDAFNSHQGLVEVKISRCRSRTMLKLAQGAGVMRMWPCHRHAAGSARSTVTSSLQPFHLAFPVRDVGEAKAFYGG